MENLVSKYLDRAGIKYSREITSCELGLPAGFAVNKRWDFAVRTTNNLYVIETNFYSSGGSKLNETARSYKLIANEASKIKHLVFVWITDGKGWESSRSNLQEVFSILDTIYNISDVEAGLFNKIFL